MQRRLFQEALSSSSNWKAIYEQPCTGAPLFRNDVSLSHTCQGRVQHSRIRYVQIIIHPAEYPTASALCKQMISLGQTGVRGEFEAFMNRNILKAALKDKDLKLQHGGKVPLTNPFHASDCNKTNKAKVLDQRIRHPLNHSTYVQSHGERRRRFRVCCACGGGT